MTSVVYRQQMSRHRLSTMVTIIFLAVLTSCTKDPVPLLTEEKLQPVTTETKTSDPNIISVEVTFNSLPAAPTATIAPLKYNKTSVVNFEFDDNPAGAYTVFQSLKTKTFPDGTGNAIKFTATCAVNSKGNYNNADLWENYQGNLTRQQAVEMVKDKWALANHGYYHSVLNSTTNFGFGKPISENISENTKYVFEKTGFRMRTLVVPSNDAGYLSPAFEQGIIATSSTNNFEGFQSYPLYGDYVNIAALPANKIHLRRDFNDRWDSEGINLIKNKLSILFSKSNEKERQLYRLGTHMADAEAFKVLSDHILSASNGNCWVTSTQEMVEYLQLKNVVVKKESFVNGKLLITLDISDVDKETFFKDITLLINADKPIKNISVTNARTSSSAVSTGMVNISF